MLKILEGNRGHRPLNEHEPQPRAMAPDLPIWLSPVAAAEWTRITTEMCEVPGWLTAVDLAIVAGYCTAFARWQQAERAIEEVGLTYVASFMDSSGQEHLQPKPRPEVAIARQERDAMKKFAVELGLSPAARGKLSINSRAGEDDDDLDP